tara:strand:+ start:4997 stop:6325 length:1329 start_codon:yes stop_codon:yes gene_type:complete
MPRRATSKSSQKPSTALQHDRPQRLQKLLASAGFGSRRQCEELIETGRVEVDGEIVTKLGTTVDPQSSKVRVDGVNLKPRKLTYYAVNKPVGVVTTNRDPQGRPRVIDLVPPTERVFPVGRLDRNSEGLILLTNDGDLAQQLTHPKFGVRKVYRVTVAGQVDNETMRKMRKGIYISEGLVKVDGAKILKARPRATDLEIVLREGKNREIRRILARFGHKVQQLRRIAVGTLRLGDTPTGAYRIVTREEVQKLRREVATAADAPQAKAEPSRKPRSGAKPKRGPASDRTSAKKTVVKPPRKRGPKSRADQFSETQFDFGESQTVGSVIGQEGSESEPKKKRSTKRKVAGKASGASGRASGRSATRGSATKGASTKRTTKRTTKRGTKKATKKRTTKKRSTKREAPAASRRGEGRRVTKRTTSSTKRSTKKRATKKNTGKKRKR